MTRHIDFVYPTALRVVNGDSNLAQDVAQTVFIDLARKAGSLPGDVGLAGCIITHATQPPKRFERSDAARPANKPPWK